ncbi:hypothetical protein GCM10018966_070250 [Streptomyces yanii]
MACWTVGRAGAIRDWRRENTPAPVARTAKVTRFEERGRDGADKVGFSLGYAGMPVLRDGGNRPYALVGSAGCPGGTDAGRGLAAASKRMGAVGHSRRRKPLHW